MRLACFIRQVEYVAERSARASLIVYILFFIAGLINDNSSTKAEVMVSLRREGPQEDQAFVQGHGGV